MEASAALGTNRADFISAIVVLVAALPVVVTSLAVLSILAATVLI